MHSLEHTLRTAIDELRCIDPARPASLTDLSAVAIARRCLDQILLARVDELRSGPAAAATWSEIATALDEPSEQAVRKRFERSLSGGVVTAFWAAHRERFGWDFVPVPFVHELYREWLAEEHPGMITLPPKALTRRIVALTRSSGTWSYARGRTASLSLAQEPLLDRVQWRPALDGRAVWGFRRLR